MNKTDSAILLQDKQNCNKILVSQKCCTVINEQASPPVLEALSAHQTSAKLPEREKKKKDEINT